MWCTVYDTFRIIHTSKCRQSCRRRVQIIILRWILTNTVERCIFSPFNLNSMRLLHNIICMRLMDNDICGCDAIDMVAVEKGNSTFTLSFDKLHCLSQCLKYNNRISGNFKRKIKEKPRAQRKICWQKPLPIVNGFGSFS